MRGAHPPCEMLVFEGVFKGKLITTGFPTRATATAAASTTAIATTAPAAATALFARTGFIDLDLTTVQRLAGKAADGGLGAFIGRHRYKCESPGTAAHAVGDQINFGHRPKFFEEVLQIVFCGVEGKISDEQFITHLF